MEHVGMNGATSSYEEAGNVVHPPYGRYMQQQHITHAENTHLMNRFGSLSLRSDADEIVNRPINNYDTTIPSRIPENYTQQHSPQHHGVGGTGGQYGNNFMDRFGGGFDFSFNIAGSRNGIPNQTQQPQHIPHYAPPSQHYPHYSAQYIDSFFQQHQPPDIRDYTSVPPHQQRQQWGPVLHQIPNISQIHHPIHSQLAPQIQHSNIQYHPEIVDNVQLPQSVVIRNLDQVITHEKEPSVINDSTPEISQPPVRLGWADFHTISKPLAPPTTSIPPPLAPPINDVHHHEDNTNNNNNNNNIITATSSKSGTPTSINDDQAQEVQVSRTLWVGNIGPDVTEQELAEEFSAFGELESVRILHDRFCAFVNFVDEEQATAAKKAMHGQIIGSQYIVVNYRQTKQGDEVAQQEPSSYAPPSRALYIGNLAESVTDKDLKRECEKYGEIESIRILHKKGCAFVNYVTVKNATSALHALQGRKLNDQVIKVNYGKAVPSKNGRDEPTGPLSVASKTPTRLTTRPNPSSPNPTQSTPPLAPLNAWTNTNTNITRPIVASPAPSPAVSWAAISAINNPLTASQEMGARDWLAENGLDICEVCYSNFRNTLFIPCHHTCCGECMAKLRASAVYTPDKGSRCPFCKEVIKQYVAITSPLTTPSNHPPSTPYSGNISTNTNQLAPSKLKYK